MAVLGLGRFGSGLALELMETGCDVLGIDADDHVVQSHNGRLAHVVRAVVEDYVEVEPSLAMVRVDTPRRLLGRDLRSVGLAGEHGMRVVAVKGREGWVYPQGHYVLEPDDRMLIVGPTRQVEAFLSQA